MSWNEWVPVVGTVLTTIGTVVTIATALKTRSYKNQIKFDIRKINLVGAIDHLKRAQDEIRKLPTTTETTPRGLKPKEVIKEIRSRFDFVMGSLTSEGPDRDIREILAKAQNELNDYEVSFDSKETDPQRVYRLQMLMQDAVSTSNSRIYKLEGKE